MKVNSWLQKKAKILKNRPAFYYKEKVWSFFKLNEEVQKYAAYYHNIFQKKIKRVSILSKNSEAMYFSILALWELGIEINFLNTRLSKKEIIFQINDSKTQLLISNILIDLEIKKIKFPKKLMKVSEKYYIDNGYNMQSIASIMYTSGTTGQPKGVPQKFINHKASALDTAENMKLNTADCWLCITPLYHISGLSILLRSLIIGFSVRLYENFNKKLIAKDIYLEKGTIVSVVSKMLIDLFEFLPKCPNFRYFLLGGGPISEDIVQKFYRKGFCIINSFGMTETCSQVIALPPKKIFEKLGSSGIPFKNTLLCIKNNEILLKGPSIISEYLNQRNPDRWDSNGWFHTRDLGYVDNEGYLYVKSRLEELIISGGENIYPIEIERIILEIPEVLETAVVGETNEIWGQIPIAYLVLSKKVSLLKILKHLSNVSKYKHPKKFFIVNKLPKTFNGKILKRKLLTKEKFNYIKEELK